MDYEEGETVWRRMINRYNRELRLAEYAPLGHYRDWSNTHARILK